jgi:cyclopropane fatty-acyl-phospholipid synthase-like methyltransferase
MLRYYQLYDKIGKMVGEEKVLDIGCGCGFLQKFVQNYSGFDFSPKAVEISNNKNVWLGSAYDKENYSGDYDTFVSTETFEHLDDLKILENIEKGKRVLFSVPSFIDVAHLRTYSEKLVYLRYKDVLEIKSIIRFNWKNNGWSEGGEETSNYILLIDSIKK